MEVTEIEKLNQLISRTDMTGNEKVDWLLDFIDSREKQLRIGDISGSLPVKCKTVGMDGELHHIEMSADFAGKTITKLSEVHKLTEDFIKEYNDR